MLEALKNEAEKTLTENGAAAYRTSGSACADFFGTAGALRNASDEEIAKRFARAYAECPDMAMKALFYARDIRGGMGERRLFRTILKWLAQNEPQSLIKNISNIPEYGRYDDLLSLEGTVCWNEAFSAIREQLQKDVKALEEGKNPSLLAKWLPSVNTSSGRARALGLSIARSLVMNAGEYRKTLSALRTQIRIVENNLRTKDYSFEYSAVPSRAMFKYRKAFIRNDGERYSSFMEKVRSGEEKINVGTLYPYDIISPIVDRYNSKDFSEEERLSMDTSWNALENFAGGRNAIAVVDGSGSMYCYGQPRPASVAISLGIYFAERNRGAFANHFITFSQNPRLVEIKGRDITEKARYCMGYNECSNTDISRVFELVLRTAVKNKVPQEELPQDIYIISDMEFDVCTDNASETCFENARRKYAEAGYELPRIIFWNVCSRNEQQPVRSNEQGAALVSGMSPRIFSMLKDGILTPEGFMRQVLCSPRYAAITA